MLKLKVEQLNLLLAAVLVGLMYHTPAFLKDLTNNLFGRFILVVVLIYLYLKCDFSCAILFCLITIVLFQNTMEGFKEGMDDDDEDEDEDEDEESETNKRAGAAGSAAEDTVFSGADDATGQLGDSASEAGDSVGVNLDQEKATNISSFLNSVNKNAKEVNAKQNKALGEEQKKFKETFVNLGQVKTKIKSLMDLDRFFKTSSEKNTIAATKDLN